MVDHLLVSLAIIRLISSALAVVLILLGLRAWHRTRDARMARMTAGFALLLVSLLIEGASFQWLFPDNLLVAHTVEATAQLVAFAILIWSLF